ncbi:hypothetical protein PG987_015256 [Apiospora arundinis]
MGALSRPPANGFAAAARKVYNPVGFSKGYNFVLWFIFAGAMFGFILARLPYLNFYGIYCNTKGSGGLGALPGECYYYLNFDRSPPYIRYKAIILHRVCGWLAILLSVIGIAGALMIAREAFGGGIEAQSITGVLAIVFLGSLLLAVINIKKLQIEEHRKWMLRAWFYGGCIITMRIILIITVNITASSGYQATMPCVKVNSILQSEEKLVQSYPACAAFVNGTNPDQYTMIDANFNGNDAAQIAASIDITAGMALWLAFIIHAVGVEIYLRLTPAEHNRLRAISYQRQLAAGVRNPGSAGLTVDRLGDSDGLWKPREQSVEEARADPSKVSLQAPSP